MKFLTDKWKHYTGCTLLAGVGAAAAFVIGWSADWQMALAAQLVAAAVGVGWEVWQRRAGTGTPEAQDAAASAAGGSLVAAALTWGTPAAWWFGAVLVVLVAWVLRSESRRQRASVQRGGGQGEE
jgi:hypothetical protein